MLNLLKNLLVNPIFITKYRLNNSIESVLTQVDLKGLDCLDVGCGDGSKTNLFAQIFGIKESNVHGCDINTWGPYSNKKMFKFDNLNFLLQ